MAVWLSFCAWTLLEQARIVPTLIPMYIVDMSPQNSNVWMLSGMPQVRRGKNRGQSRGNNSDRELGSGHG